MARDRAPAAPKTHLTPESKPASRARRALLALSPAALGAAGFFNSGLRGRKSAGTAEAAPASGQRSDGMTAHRKAYYDRARL